MSSTSVEMPQPNEPVDTTEAERICNAARIMLFVVEQRLIHNRDLSMSEWHLAYANLRTALGEDIDPTYPEHHETKDARVLEKLERRSKDPMRRFNP